MLLKGSRMTQISASYTSTYSTFQQGVYNTFLLQACTYRYTEYPNLPEDHSYEELWPLMAGEWRHFPVLAIASDSQTFNRVLSASTLILGRIVLGILVDSNTV